MYEYKTKTVGASVGTKVLSSAFDAEENREGWTRVWTDITMEGSFIVYRREVTATAAPDKSVPDKASIENRCMALFEKLVPNEGMSNTVEGEMIRAISRIIYRFSNDGDYFWDESVGSAHAYLVTRSPLRMELYPIFSQAQGLEGDEYNAQLLKAAEIIVTYVEGQKTYTYNKTDMWGVESLYKEDATPEY